MRPSSLILLAVTLVPLGWVSAQSGTAPRRCQLDVLSVDREGYYEDFQSGVNYFAGGNVRMRCRNQPIFLDGDSLASFNQQVVWLITNARYRDESIDLRADTMIYTAAEERFQFRGNVTGKNLANGSTLTGPWVDYLRAATGLRDSSEVIARQRPTVTYPVARAAGDSVDPAPYTVSAEELRARGSSWSEGWGNVEIDRGALQGRGDSVAFQRSEEELLTLAGAPATLTRIDDDSLAIAGKHVRLAMQGEQLQRVDAFGGATVRRGDVFVDADSTILDFEADQLSQLRAWDDSRPAKVLASGFDVRGDSIAIETPGERLRELRVFRRGTLMQPLDSAAAPASADSTTTDSLPPIRNTITGAAIRASFVDHDSSGVPVTRLSRIFATGSATALFSRTVLRSGVPSPTVNYTRGDTLIIEMKVGEKSEVQEVRAYRGSEPVDGIQLERATLRARASGRPETRPSVAKERP